jgi:dihydroorotase
MVGLESALSIVLLTMVETGELTWVDVERVMSRTPAQIGRLDWRGLSVGAPARLTLVDPGARQVFATEHLAGRSTNSPYLGRELPGRIMYTAFDGYLTVDHGALVPADTVAGQALDHAMTRGVPRG